MHAVPTNNINNLFHNARSPLPLLPDPEVYLAVKIVTSKYFIRSFDQNNLLDFTSNNLLPICLLGTYQLCLNFLIMPQLFYRAINFSQCLQNEVLKNAFSSVFAHTIKKLRHN